MAAAEVEDAPAPAMPDYMTDPNAVLKDINATWRYGQPPDYSKTRTYYEQTKQSKHEPGGLLNLVENLVKNWEVEASFKTKLSDWRTIDQDNYSFSINGGPSQTGEDMLKNGTYNAIIQPGNEYYCPRFSDFSSSHKTFKRMMPTFAWEVLDVVGAPPKVAVKWRHWGVMKNDYVGFNNKGEQVTAKAHGGTIDIQGTTWATVNDKLQVTNLETWFDPVEMFRQIAGKGIVNKATVAVDGNTASHPNPTTGPEQATNTEGLQDAEMSSSTSDSSYVEVSVDNSNKRPADQDVTKLHDEAKATQDTIISPPLNGEIKKQGDDSAVVMSGDKVSPTAGLSADARTSSILEFRQSSTSASIPADSMDVGYPPGAFPTAKPSDQAVSNTSNAQAPTPPLGEIFTEGQRPSQGAKVTTGEPNGAVALPGDSAEARRTHEELSTTTRSECPFMNKE